MRVQDLLSVLGVAVVTMAFTLVSLGPGRVGATDEDGGIKPTIAQPKLTVDGCVFTVKTDKESYQPGETPVLRIEATNPTGRPVEATVWVAMTARSLKSLISISRTLSAPESLLSDQHECTVSLEPGQTKSIDIASEVKLQAGQMVSITISDKQQAVIANRLSVQNNTPLQAINQAINQAVPVTQVPAEK